MAGNTEEKAGMAEAAFISFAFRHGWEIAKPFSHAQGYDFIIRHHYSAGWQTVQVKAAYLGRDGRRKPCRVASLRRCNEKGSRPYVEGDFDLLFVWDGDANLWLIPWSQVAEVRSSITLMNTNGLAKRFKDWIAK